MNIFLFDPNIAISASYYPDCYYKIVLEIAQMCSTTKRLYSRPGLISDTDYYKVTHRNHPMTKWVGSNLYTYMFAIEVGLAIEREMVGRGFKPHKSARVLEWLREHPPLLPALSTSLYPLCMPDIYKGADTFESYRRYFKGEKYGKINCRWTNRPLPYWLS